MSDPFLESVERLVASRKKARIKLFKGMKAACKHKFMEPSKAVTNKGRPSHGVRTKSIKRKPTKGERYNNKEMISKINGLVLGRG